MVPPKWGNANGGAPPSDGSHDENGHGWLIVPALLHVLKTVARYGSRWYGWHGTGDVMLHQGGASGLCLLLLPYDATVVVEKIQDSWYGIYHTAHHDHRFEDITKTIASGLSSLDCSGDQFANEFGVKDGTGTGQ